MKKANLLILSALTIAACATPTDEDTTTAGDGDGDDVSMGTGGQPLGSSGGSVGVGGGDTTTGGSGTVGSGGTFGGSVGGTASGVGGTASSVGGSTSTAVTCTGSSFMVNNGYADNGTLCGYAWTASYDGGVIAPPCGTGECFMGTTLCATGSIPATAAPLYPGVMIGWNVAQPLEGTTAQTWSATGTGITVNFDTGGATGETRVVIQSGTTDYCATATSGSPIPWSSFTVECWTGGLMSPAFSAGTPVTAIAVQINSTDLEQTFTDFCVSGVTVN